MKEFGQWLIENVPDCATPQQLIQPDVIITLEQYKNVLFNQAVNEIESNTINQWQSERSKHLAIVEEYVELLAHHAAATNYMMWGKDGNTYVEVSNYNLTLDDVRKLCLGGRLDA